MKSIIPNSINFYTNFKFAQKFRPKVTASNLGKLLSARTCEKEYVKLLSRHEPFKSIGQLRTRKLLPLTQNQKSLIRSIQNDFQLNTKALSLEYNDEKVIEKFMNNSSIFINHDQKFDEKLLRIYAASMRGKILENRILHRVNLLKNKHFIQVKSKKVANYSHFDLIGIADGIDLNEKKLLEIKTKSNFDKTKNTITKQEKVQVLAYMNLYDCNSCLFVESGPNGDLKDTIIDYEACQFQLIVDTISELCSNAKNLTEGQYKDLLQKHDTV